MQAKTYQINPGEKVEGKIPARRVHILLNREDTEVYVSSEKQDKANLSNSALIRAADCPVRFIHKGTITLWTSMKDPHGQVVGVSVILEEVM